MLSYMIVDIIANCQVAIGNAISSPNILEEQIKRYTDSKAKCIDNWK